MADTDDWLEIPVGGKKAANPAHIERIGDPKFDNDPPDPESEGEAEAEAEGRESSQEAAESDEHEQYSESVKRRIASLTRKFREAERQRDAAAEYARQIQAERDQFRAQAQQYSSGYVSQHAKGLERDIADTKRALSAAMEKNDNAALVEAQTKLTELMWEQQRVKQATLARSQAQQPAQQFAQQPVRQAAPQPPQPDEKAVRWAEQNTWFGTDRVLTQTALAAHAQLVEDEGFDPKSDEYYNELDSRMARFLGPKRTGPAVAGVTRAAKPGGARKVKLTKSQVDMANRLGVPLEEYAKYVRQ